MTRSTDITSLSEYRQRLREHHDRLKETGRPLYVTANGEPDAVVMSPKAYDELADRAELPEIIAMITRSKADLDAGRASDARDALRRIAQSHQIPFDR